MAAVHTRFTARSRLPPALRHQKDQQEPRGRPTAALHPAVAALGAAALCSAAAAVIYYQFPSGGREIEQLGERLARSEARERSARAEARSSARQAKASVAELATTARKLAGAMQALAEAQADAAAARRQAWEAASEARSLASQLKASQSEAQRLCQALRLAQAGGGRAVPLPGALPGQPPPAAVAYVGGRELKPADARMLPPGVDVRFFGSPQDMGRGELKRLLDCIKAGGVDHVYMLTRFNGHSARAHAGAGRGWCGGKRRRPNHRPFEPSRAPPSTTPPLRQRLLVMPRPNTTLLLTEWVSLPPTPPRSAPRRHHKDDPRRVQEAGNPGVPAGLVAARAAQGGGRGARALVVNPFQGGGGPGKVPPQSYPRKWITRHGGQVGWGSAVGPQTAELLSASGRARTGSDMKTKGGGTAGVGTAVDHAKRCWRGTGGARCGHGRPGSSRIRQRAAQSWAREITHLMESAQGRGEGQSTWGRLRAAAKCITRDWGRRLAL